MDKKLSKGFEKAPLIVQMLTAGAGGCISDLITFPTDTVKVRCQIAGEGGKKSVGLATIIRKMAAEEGYLAFYKGFAAGLQRQVAFASIRIGVYDKIKLFYHRLFGIGENEIHVPARILAGLTSACVAVGCAQPTDVVKIRFQGSEKGRYKSTGAAYAEILRKDGVKGLWQGVLANMTRNAICNVSEVVVYDVVRDALLKFNLFNDGVHLHVTTAIIAGFFTTVVTSPFDVVKTRYMNAPHGVYKSATDCALRTIRAEGFLALYKGFSPNVLRLVSWNLCFWVAYEQLKILVAKHYRDKE